MAVCQSGQPIPDSTFCRRFIESVRMMACVIRASRWEASHCIACVTASTSMVRLEVVKWLEWLADRSCCWSHVSWRFHVRSSQAPPVGRAFLFVCLFLALSSPPPSPTPRYQCQNNQPDDEDTQRMKMKTLPTWAALSGDQSPPCRIHSVLAKEGQFFLFIIIISNNSNSISSRNNSSSSSRNSMWRSDSNGRSSST